MQQLVFDLDPDLVEYIKNKGRDYRVCTSCAGPVILPVEYKKPKETDFRIKIGENTLFVSAVQAKYIRKFTRDMVYDGEV
jgi:hypothetical protein